MARKKQSRRSSIVSASLTVLSLIVDIFKSPVVISWILAIAGLITLTAMSVPKLRATRVSAADINVTFHDPPVWIDESLLFKLQDVARVHLAKTTVGREGLMQTADKMAATGWFTNVNQVRWISDNHAVIDATFLIPYAKVIDKDGEVLIDAQGRRLPTRTGIIVNPKYHFITIKNTIHARPQRFGLQWNGGDILSALKVLHLIYNKPWATQILSIDLSLWTADGSITFITETPSRLKWGSAPNEERGLEALADDKIKRLNWLHTNFGRIDKGISVNLDLTNTAEITIQ
tara:strand:- start:920 stop:1786 length:867 start_codon:yes stop_codon:yes gene_type:complete